MAKKYLYLVFAVHNHQPVGNLDIVFEKAMEDCYGPLLDAMEQLPEGSKLSLHYSGPLIEWIEERNPSYFERIKGLVQKNVAEMISGGFYEPMLAAIDPDDAVGQIRMMNEYLKNRLSARPKSMWLTERVWTSIIPQVMSNAGISATMVDDHAFMLAGIRQKPITGYWVTEWQGSTAKVFGIDQHLRYLIPFHDPQEVVDYLRDVYNKSEGSTVIVYGDDGEKFGIWPGTKEWVVQRQYLQRLFKALTAQGSWLKLAHISDVLQDLRPNGRIYLPESSYPEMMEWAQPTEARKQFESLVHRLKELNMWDMAAPFVKGGVWFNFLSKYVESNLMHKKGVFIKKYLNSAQHPGADMDLLDEARRELYKAQCNCGYWHGLFGGLYLGHLREAIYKHYTKAERLIDMAVYDGKEWVDQRVIDYDADGVDEMILRNPHVFLLIHPGFGGSIADLTFKDKNFNFQNMLMRYEEAYHDEVGKGHSGGSDEGAVSIHELQDSGDPSLRNYLIYDKYPRFSGYTYLFRRPVTPEEYRTNNLGSAGIMLGGAYRFIGHSTVRKNEARSILESDFIVNLDTIPFGLNVRKVYSLKPDGTITLTHELTNKGAESMDVYLGVEFNLTVLSPGDDLHRLLIDKKQIPGIGISSIGSIENIRSFSLEDAWKMMRIDIASARPITLVFTPIHTVSHSEKGFEAVYQGTGFMALVPVTLIPGVVASHSFTIRLLDFGGSNV